MMVWRWTMASVLAGLLVLGAPAVVWAQGSGEGNPRRGQLTKAPKLLSGQQPDYTKAALDARVEGEVRLKITISASGEVSKVEVIKGLGYGLDQAAADAVKKFKFSPAEIDNEAAAVILPFTIKFELPVLPSEFEGAVVDSGSGEGLAGASVTITYTGKDLPAGTPPPSATGVTDAQGKFSFQNVPAGEYAVTLKIQAYEPFTTSITLVAGKKSGATYKIDAKPFNLRGTIKEAGTRAVLPGVRVEVVDPKDPKVVLRETFTDETGAFGFRGVPVGTYTVRVSAKGYITASFKEEVKAGEVLTARYAVQAQYYDPYTVRTTAKRERREVSRQTIKLDEVRRIPGTGGDVVRVVQNLPGVARPAFVSGAIIVRGAAPQDTQIFLDGDNIPFVYHFFGGPAVINSEMIESIDFMPGNFSTQYGRATAGVINLNTRSPKTDRLHGFAEIDLLDATLLLEGPITKDLSFAFSFRRSYYDAFLGAVIPDDTVDIVAAPRYYDYQLWLTYRGFKDHKLEFLFYGARDKVELLLPENEPQGNADVVFTGANLRNAFYRGQLKWDWTPKAPIKNRLMISYGLNQVGFQAAENLFFNGDFYQTQIREELTMQLHPKFTLRTGGDFQLGTVEYTFEIPRFSNNDDGRDDRQEGTGLGGRPNFGTGGALGQRLSPVMQPAYYVEADWKPLKGLTLIPGIRLDYYGTISELSPSPRLAARWQLDDKRTWVIKGGVGRFTQPVNPGFTEPAFGNPNLTSEKALQYSVGAEWRPKEFLEFDTTLFYRDIYDLATNTDQFTLDEDGNPKPLVFLNEGSGRAYGLEVLLRHYPRERFFGWIAYTLSRSERRNLTTGELQPYNFDQTHILTLVGGYNLPWGIDLSGRFRLVTGNPITPIVGGVYDAESDEYRPTYGAPLSARNATFRQLDIRLDKKFVFDSWILGLYLDVLNVTNAENAEGRRYNYNFTESAPVLGLPIIPTLGVNARF